MQEILNFISNHPYISVAWFSTLFALLYSILSSKDAKSITTQDATLLTNKEQAIIFDLRDKNSFASGHILGAINIDPKSPENFDKKIVQEKDIILVCLSGNSAYRFAKKIKKDFKSRLHVLKGGMIEWQNQNLPINKA